MPRLGWLAGSVSAQLVASLCGLATNVVYARQLSLREVGVIALVNSYAMLGAVFLDRGVGTVVTRQVAAGVLSPATGRSYYTRAGAMPLAAVTISLMGASVFERSPVWIMLLGVLASFWWFQRTLVVAQSLQLAGVRSWVIAGNGVATTLLTVGALELAPTVAVALSASLVAYLIAAVLGMSLIMALRREEMQSIAKEVPPGFANTVRQARPLFGSTLASYGVGVGDVILAAHLLSPSELGVYALGKKLAQAATLPFSSVLPLLVGRMAARSVLRRVQMFVAFACGFGGLASLGVFVGAPILDYLSPIVFDISGNVLVAPTLGLLVVFAMQVTKDAVLSLLIAFNEYRASLVVNSVTLGALLGGGLLISALGTPAPIGRFVFGFGTAMFVGACCGLVWARLKIGASGGRALWGFAALLGPCLAFLSIRSLGGV